MLITQNELIAAEQTTSHWECRRHAGRGNLGGGVVHVGAVFPKRNTVVFAPTHYKQSIPVNTGNFVMRQHSNMSTKDPHTALTQAVEEKLELQ